MRKNILFIAKFDNVLKGMNALLAKVFNMQMCPPEAVMIKKTLGVMEIDLVLLYISGLPERSFPGLCDELEEIHLNTPIVVLGTTDQCEDFDKYYNINVSKYLHRPIGAQDIIITICTLLDIEVEAGAPAPPVAPVMPVAPVAPIKPNMSLADFANSLEADEQRRILVVDDNGVILRAMKMLLEKKYKVSLANSAMSALESIGRERPDAVLLDYEMPICDGKQTLEMIRKNKDTQNLPVFFLTGVTDRDRVIDVMSLRPQGYFLKNSEPGEILQKLDEFFKNSQK